MRSIGRLLLLVMTLLGLALTSGSASAQQFEISDEAGEPCGEVVIAVHEVSGGCHIALEGEIVFWVHNPAETPGLQCDWDLEAQIGQDGSGYVTSATLTPGPILGCDRTACDEPDHTAIPWPFHLVESAPGDEEVEMTFCLRLSGAEEGTVIMLCETQLRLTHLGDHQYEVGQLGRHHFCEESSSPLPVSFSGHLNAPGGEAVEIIHHQSSAITDRSRGGQESTSDSTAPSLDIWDTVLVSSWIR